MASFADVGGDLFALGYIHSSLFNISIHKLFTSGAEKEEMVRLSK